MSEIYNYLYKKHMEKKKKELEKDKRDSKRKVKREVREVKRLIKRIDKELIRVGCYANFRDLNLPLKTISDYYKKEGFKVRVYPITVAYKNNKDYIRIEISFQKEGEK